MGKIHSMHGNGHVKNDHGFQCPDIAELYEKHRNNKRAFSHVGSIDDCVPVQGSFHEPSIPKQELAEAYRTVKELARIVKGSILARIGLGFLSDDPQSYERNIAQARRLLKKSEDLRNQYKRTRDKFQDYVMRGKETVVEAKEKSQVLEESIRKCEEDMKKREEDIEKLRAIGDLPASYACIAAEGQNYEVGKQVKCYKNEQEKLAALAIIKDHEAKEFAKSRNDRDDMFQMLDRSVGIGAIFVDHAQKVLEQKMDDTEFYELRNSLSASLTGLLGSYSAFSQRINSQHDRIERANDRGDPVVAQVTRRDTSNGNGGYRIDDAGLLARAKAVFEQY